VLIKEALSFYLFLKKATLKSLYTKAIFFFVLLFFVHMHSMAERLRDVSGSPQRSEDYKRTARTTVEQ
jgi:hypothetical protein